MNIIHILLFKVFMIVLNLHRPCFLTGEKIFHKITGYQLHFLYVKVLLQLLYFKNFYNEVQG